MTTTVQAVPVPLREDAEGAVRIGKTRVLLELVIRAFDDGETPESIVESYPPLDLADVYAVLAYYLSHADTVHDYLRRRDREAAEMRAKIEANQPRRDDLRQRIIAKRRSRSSQ